MKNNPKLLAYCLDNKASAKQLEGDLAKAGISFKHYIGEHSNSNISKELLKTKGDIFLLISDNFLKSSHCMVDALELLAKGIQENRIQAIIVETDSKTGEAVQPTQFSRISDLINYMNFWQERYLKLRKTKDTVPKGKIDDFEKELKRVRVISAEIGEFLRMLRDTEYWTLDQLQKDHYALFFNKIGKQDLINTIQKEASPPTPPEKELEAIKKELNIANRPVTETENLETEVQESAIQMKKEQEETQMIFSSIFENEDDNADKENNDTEEDAGEERFQNWEEIENGEGSESELTNKMQVRFFERIDQLIENADEITAARELKQYLTVNSKSAEAHYYLALIESSNENFDSAKDHAEQAVELSPNNSNYHLTLGRILFHHFSDNPKSAEHSFKNAIKMNPANLAAHYEYAMLLHEVLNKPKKAISQLELTLAIQPQHPFANYDLALIYYGMEKREKAAMYYQKAFSINPELRTPDNDIAFWYESYLQAELKEKDEEIEALEKSNPVEVESPEITVESIEEEEDYLDPEEALMNEMSEQDELDQEIADLLLEKDDSEISLADREVIIAPSDHLEEEKEEIEIVPMPTPTTKKETNNIVKTIMITGATSGIGKATAIVFAKAGHRLILTGRREGRLNEFKKELQGEYNNEITVLDFDVRYLSAAKKSYNSLGEDWENIDLLINNAGLAKGFDPIHEGDVKHWETMLDTNVKGLLFMTRIVSPGMVARGYGQIINVCSSAGHEVYPNGAVYCATKHAVDALTRGMRLDLFKHGIRVGQVSPGHVEETEFAVVRFDGDKERAKIYDDFNPLTSSDVADAIFYMANAPAHVTIQDIVMMGTQQASNVFIDRSGRDE